VLTIVSTSPKLKSGMLKCRSKWFKRNHKLPSHNHWKWPCSYAFKCGWLWRCCKRTDKKWPIFS